MTSQQGTAGSDGDSQVTMMSSRATAFTIDQLLRPDLHVITANRRRHDCAADSALHQQSNVTRETTAGRNNEWRPLRTGTNEVQRLYMYVGFRLTYNFLIISHRA